MAITFQRRFQQSIKKRGEHSTIGLWLNTIIVAGLVFLASAIYLAVRSTRPFGLGDVNAALAVTGLAVTGLSMLLAPVCYFWDFADTKIIYRKHLGWIGLSAIVLHIIASIFFLPARYPFGTYFPHHLLFFTLGVLSFAIFVVIAAVSNRFAAHELGGVAWRRLLRLVYPAYILAVLHFTVRSAPFWLAWVRSPSTLLPPLSLLLVLFSLFIFAMRIVLWGALRKKARSAKKTSTTLLVQAKSSIIKQPVAR